MKVLIISSNHWKYNFGGAELQIKYIIDFLLLKNIEIHYVFLNDKTIEKKENGVFLHGIKRKKKSFEWLFGEIIYYREVYDKLFIVKPDVIYHRNLGTLALPIIKYSRKFKIKSVFHIALIKDAIKKMSWSYNLLSSLIRYFAVTRLMNNFDFIIAQANYQNDLLSTNFNRKADLIMGNAHPLPVKPVHKKKEIVVLWVANLKEAKQPQSFIELASELTSFDVQFIMIGRNPYNGWSSKIIEKISKNIKLSYMGEQPVEVVNELLSTSHIFVNTSLFEGFPNTFIQAWMRKVPVVSLHVDPDDVIKNNQLGFHSKSFSQMVEDVKKLILNNELRNEIGTNTRSFSIMNYSVNNFEKLYDLIK